MDFFVLFFPRKKAPKNPPENPPQNSPRVLVGKIPLRFLQKPFLDYLVNFGCVGGPNLTAFSTERKVLENPNLLK